MPQDDAILRPCSCLRVLYLYDNALSCFPRALQHLAHLESLYLQANELVGVAEAPSMPRLRTLNLRGNRIAAVRWTALMPELRELDLSEQRIDGASLSWAPENAQYLVSARGL